MARNLTPEQEKELGLSDEFQRNLENFTNGVLGSATSDKRLVAIARTQFELGFMVLNKAIANPENRMSTERVIADVGAAKTYVDDNGKMITEPR